jgi:hypothetical protein
MNEKESQAPNSKSQINSNFSNFNDQNGVWRLEGGYYLGFGAWNLGF